MGLARDKHTKGVNMLKFLAILMGLIFLISGVLGFFPTYAPTGKLFNLFLVNFPHNLIHTATGIIAILCGFSSSRASRSFFIILGLAYAGIAGLGFYTESDMLFKTIANNTADNWLHAGIAIISLYVGFFLGKK